MLRATIKGRAVAEKDLSALAKYAAAKLGLSEKATRAQWETNLIRYLHRQTALHRFYSLA